MTSNKTSLLQSTLQELRALRQEIQEVKSTVIRIEATGISRPTPLSSTTTSIGQLPPARRLLQDIANRPPVLSPCWYHRKHGIATYLPNCPGPKSCSWNQEKELRKMQETINKLKPKKPSLQQRLASIRNSTPPNQQVPLTTPVPVLPNIENPSWNQLMDIENTPPTGNLNNEAPPSSSLEEDLLMSESE